MPRLGVDYGAHRWPTQDLPASMPRPQVALYDLIWRRTLACQMANAQIQQVGGGWAPRTGARLPVAALLHAPVSPV